MNKINSRRKIIKTKFGLVMTNLSTKQQKVLNELIFSTSNPDTHNTTPESVLNGSSTSRKVPELEIKKDHLLVSGFSLVKNLKSGDWEVVEIKTNQGHFTTSDSQTKKLNQKLIRELAIHLKNILEPDLVSFLDTENL